MKHYVTAATLIAGLVIGTSAYADQGAADPSKAGFIGNPDTVSASGFGAYAQAPAPRLKQTHRTAAPVVETPTSNASPTNSLGAR